ncbi:uncharacterized protein LOC133658289 [Entelurus aequoreus]|uniref:uncharacterized protein LOC133658289 n=1 Tax=Entelurus aequoreus TaxID=161455 RepID=UPI002B1E8EFF|nr:uncharacterized protein LOC133658289 [Entelurus aequoreus]
MYNFLRLSRTCFMPLFLSHFVHHTFNVGHECTKQALPTPPLETRRDTTLLALRASRPHPNPQSAHLGLMKTDGIKTSGPEDPVPERSSLPYASHVSRDQAVCRDFTLDSGLPPPILDPCLDTDLIASLQPPTACRPTDCLLALPLWSDEGFIQHTTNSDEPAPLCQGMSRECRTQICGTKQAPAGDTASTPS